MKVNVQRTFHTPLVLHYRLLLVFSARIQLGFNASTVARRVSSRSPHRLCPLCNVAARLILLPTSDHLLFVFPARFGSAAGRTRDGTGTPGTEHFCCSKQARGEAALCSFDTGISSRCDAGTVESLNTFNLYRNVGLRYRYDVYCR